MRLTLDRGLIQARLNPALADAARTLAIGAGISCAVVIDGSVHHGAHGEPACWSGAAVATVNKLTYGGSRYSLGSRYAPSPRRMSSDGPPSRAGGAIGPTAAWIGKSVLSRRSRRPCNWQ
ncbi:hypothetical protein BQ8794_50126 [Mesorhizobium prunaredense]|uniref:Uncharacterized protein n=1 Tax=Mesorhizobium prunaredense TaxID=1631249 RepID=A0A1R3VDT2_9HYPH|nr:hypothetical protein BQ8794_50126 [Mesorhizobium prunaredense]